MIEADCIDPEDVSDDFEGVSADGFDEPEALVGTFGVGESVRVGDYLVELTDAYMEDEGTVSLDVNFQNAGGSPVPMPDWDTRMSLQDQDGYRYDRDWASRNTTNDHLSPDATVDAVAACQRGSDQRQHLVPSVRPSRRAAEVKVTVDEFPQAQVPGQGGRQEQAGIGHQAMVVKEDADTVGFVLWQHLLGAPCFRAGFCFKTIIPDSEEHPLVPLQAECDG